ncbi:MAG: hypothetical protein U9Q64_13300, partial [Pseudomonadota bacterium]|nr:hypothetical protein [Pseudomonadota bacterium]
QHQAGHKQGQAARRHFMAPALSGWSSALTSAWQFISTLTPLWGSRPFGAKSYGFAWILPSNQWLGNSVISRAPSFFCRI